jgi:hypothetical protein
VKRPQKNSALSFAEFRKYECNKVYECHCFGYAGRLVTEVWNISNEVYHVQWTKNAKDTKRKMSNDLLKSKKNVRRDSLPVSKSTLLLPASSPFLKKYVTNLKLDKRKHTKAGDSLNQNLDFHYFYKL